MKRTIWGEFTRGVAGNFSLAHVLSDIIQWKGFL